MTMAAFTVYRLGSGRAESHPTRSFSGAGRRDRCWPKAENPLSGEGLLEPDILA
jgi:hypothetical protein